MARNPGLRQETAQRVVQLGPEMFGDDIAGGDIGFFEILEQRLAEKDDAAGQMRGLLNPAAQRHQPRRTIGRG